MAYFACLLKSLKNSDYYSGSTKDRKTQQGQKQAYKKGILWGLVYEEEYPDRSSVLKRELEIKKRKIRKYIESLIRASR